MTAVSKAGIDELLTALDARTRAAVMTLVEGHVAAPDAVSAIEGVPAAAAGESCAGR